MRTVIILPVLLLLWATLGSVPHQMTRPGPTKTWRFETPQGRVSIYVYAHLKKQPVWSLLAIGTSEGKTAFTLTEEVAFLQRVVGEMPSIGVDPRSVTVLQLLIEPDVQERLALACARSDKWRKDMKDHEGGNTVIGELLTAIGAYDELNRVFDEYGLTVTNVGGVEDIIVDKLRNLHLKSIPRGIDENLLVPVTAHVEILLGQKAAARTP